MAKVSGKAYSANQIAPRLGQGPIAAIKAKYRDLISKFDTFDDISTQNHWFTGKINSPMLLKAGR